MEYDWIMFVIWSMVLLVSVIIELNTSALVGWASAAGATISLILHAIFRGDLLWLEITSYFVVWASLWIAFYLIFKKGKLNDKEVGYLALIGKEAIVNKTNENLEYGEIKIGDKFFRFKHEDTFKENDKVILEKIKGVTAQIRKGV